MRKRVEMWPLLFHHLQLQDTDENGLASEQQVHSAGLDTHTHQFVKFIPLSYAKWGRVHAHA